MMPPRPGVNTAGALPPPAAPSPGNNKPAASTSTIAGRIVRLHFSCRAPIPMGSSLRVSTSLGNTSTTTTTTTTTTSDCSSLQGMYQQSVEMITTPALYPVFRTKQPVIIVLNHPSRKAFQHHYYRYMIVSPAVDTAFEEPDRAAIVQTDYGYPGLVQFENPFAANATTTTNNNNNNNNTTTTTTAKTNLNHSSTVSLASSVVNPAPTMATTTASLPYRMVDIRVDTASVAESIEDVWNNPDDITFQPFRIRDAIHEEKRRKNVTAEGHLTPPAFSKSSRIFFTCFHLPVVVVKTGDTWQASWSESILARTEGSEILRTYSGYWVGTVTTHPPLQTPHDREVVTKLLEGMKCIPIFLDPALLQSHYYGFCKQVLWPAFHNIDLLDLSTCGWLSDPHHVASDWDQSRLDDWWQSYRAVNEVFKTKMQNMLQTGDIVWIHDYHLSLLPELLTNYEMERYRTKITRKVFFLHIPFPTSQIFRELECGENILTGILHADVVGFHAFDHARHFLNAVKRILGLNYESLVGGLIGVNFNENTVLVTMSNVSIEPRMIDAALQLDSVKAGQMALKQKHGDRIIIGGLDIGQRLSGVSLKLLAFERLLQDVPSWQKRVVMVQRLLVPGSREADEKLTTREVRGLVNRIKDRFGEAVIDYQEMVGNTMPMDQRLALWKASDILMGTPIREGLNHWPMEFIYAHKEPDAPGLVITSEFSAVSSILNGALRVNPYDIPATITVLDKALSMGREEREGCRYRDIDFVSNSQSDKWVKNVLRDLKDATSVRQNSTGSESNSQVSTPYAMTPNNNKAQEDTTAAFLNREISQAFSHLHLKDLKRAYDATQRRVIVLDFNGTIVVKEPPGKYLKREILGTSGNKPPPEVLDALSKLCADPKNTVYVVSGDSSENVLQALGHLPSLGLAVSNGACFSPPLENVYERRRWLTFDLGVDWDAVKRVALPVLSKYTARSNGSFVKLTAFSIGWSYYSCDPEWGSMQAVHLVMELENELRFFDVRFVTLKGIVEILPSKLNKGLIVRKVLYDTTIRQDMEGDGVDFVLCIGDDVSDEKMFSSVYSFAAELGDSSKSNGGPPLLDEDGETEDTDMDTTTGPTLIPDPMYAFTVAVGKKPTQAISFVNDPYEVANALVMLASGEVAGGSSSNILSPWTSGDANRMFE